MGQAKLKRITHPELRSGQHACAYCGSAPGTTVDHMPPKVIFDAGHRPAFLEFPSCNSCNATTRAADQIVGWLSRAYPNAQTTPQRRDQEKLIAGVRNNYGEVATDLIPKRRINYIRQPSGLLAKTEMYETEAGPYVLRTLRQFTLKFGLAMHWHIFKSPLPRDGRVEVFAFTNQQVATAELPSALLQYFNTPKYLALGAAQPRNQFIYDSIRDESSDITAHVCSMRQSLVLFAVVHRDRATVLIGPETNVMAPDEILLPYPYGLPVLTPDQLNSRKLAASISSARITQARLQSFRKLRP